MDFYFVFRVFVFFFLFFFCFFFSSRRRHTRSYGDWSSTCALPILRQALAVLEEGGLVRRVPGRGGGTFVSKGKIERDLSRVVGVPALLRSQGVVAGTR